MSQLENLFQNNKSPNRADFGYPETRPICSTSSPDKFCKRLCAKKKIGYGVRVSVKEKRRDIMNSKGFQ